MKTLKLTLTAAIVALSFTCFATNKMTGTYTVGSANSTFKTINEAVTALETNGAEGAVTFIVDNAAYNQQQIIEAMVKTSAKGNIAFVNAEDQNNTADAQTDANTVALK